MFYRQAAYTILAMSISILPCFSQEGWRGRPWHTNTNAPTWQALQAEYQPFQQLVEALIERADVVRATGNTNYPRIELVQTWQVDAGSVTNIIGTNEVLVAFGFAADVNGTYTEASPDYWVSGDRIIAGPASGWTWLYAWEIYADQMDWDPAYGSSTGPESASWVDFGGGTPVDGATVYGPASIEVNLVTTNVVTTNAFGPFPYSVEVGGQTYSGTGFPHLTYAAMEWIDQTIEDLSEYYVPFVAATSLPPSGAFVWLWQDEWDTHGQYSLIGNAGVGTNETGTYMSGTNEYNWVMSAYTRQPPVISQWVMAEWAWDGTNWVEIALGGEMDMRLPMGAGGPYVEAYSATSGAPISVTVTLAGEVRSNHWWHTGVNTGATETVESGSYATNLWHRLLDGTSVSGVGQSTGDYVVVSCKGPITLYGTRPYRLYASDLDERAAVIDGLRYHVVEHGWTNYHGDERTFPLVTNALMASGSSSATNIVDTNMVWTLSMTDLIPHGFAAPVAGSPIFQDYNDWITWQMVHESEGLVWYEDPWTPVITGYVETVTLDAAFRSAQLVYSFDFSTNNMQGSAVPSQFVLRTPAASFPADGDNTYPVFTEGPTYYYTTNGTLTNWVATFQIAHTNNISYGGPVEYLSGRVGFGVWPADSIPASAPDYVYAPTNFYDISLTWRPYFIHGSESNDVSRRPIPGLIDWGTTNGFRYRKPE